MDYGFTLIRENFTREDLPSIMVVPHFQSICILDGEDEARTIFNEVLARFPKNTELCPQKFFGSLTSSGKFTVDALNVLVAEGALTNPNIDLSVNIYLTTLANKNFQNVLLSLPDDIRPRLHFEIVETGEDAECALARPSIKLINDLGFGGLWLDDVAGQGVFRSETLERHIELLRPETIPYGLKIDWAGNRTKEHEVGRVLSIAKQHGVTGIIYEQIANLDIVQALRKRTQEEGFAAYFQSYFIHMPSLRPEITGNASRPWERPDRLSDATYANTVGFLTATAT